jgi:hypothetical protein
MSKPENKYVYVFYISTKTTNSIDIDVRDEGVTEEEWDSFSENQKDKFLAELLNDYKSNLADMGWYLKIEGD